MLIVQTFAGFPLHWIWEAIFWNKCERSCVLSERVLVVNCALASWAPDTFASHTRTKVHPTIPCGAGADLQVVSVINDTLVSLSRVYGGNRWGVTQQSWSCVTHGCHWSYLDPVETNPFNGIQFFYFSSVVFFLCVKFLHVLQIVWIAVANHWEACSIFVKWVYFNVWSRHEVHSTRTHCLHNADW